MVRPDALPASTQLNPTEQQVDLIIDALKKGLDTYLDTDLPRPTQIVFGDPEELVALPLIGVLPDSGGLGRLSWEHTERQSIITIRVYLEQQPTGNLRDPDRRITRYKDAIIALFTEGWQTLQPATPDRPEVNAWGGDRQINWRIRSFAEQLEGEQLVSVKGCEIDLPVQAFDRRTNG